MSKNNGAPYIRIRERPPLPTLDPQRKEVLDNMTPEEMQYALARIKEACMKQATQQTSQNQPAPPLPHPDMRQFQEDALYCERVMTGGYEIEYKPPTQGGSQEQGEGFNILEMISKGLTSFRPELKQRLQEAVVGIVETVDKKMKEAK